MLAKLAGAMDFVDALTAGVLVFFMCVPTTPAAAVAGILVVACATRRIVSSLVSGKDLEARMTAMEQTVKRIANKFGIG